MLASVKNSRPRKVPGVFKWKVWRDCVCPFDSTCSVRHNTMNKERLAKALSLCHLRCFFIVTDEVYFNNIYSTFNIGWVQCKCFIRVKISRQNPVLLIDKGPILALLLPRGHLHEVKGKSKFQTFNLALAYETWSLTRGSKYNDFTGKLLVFWKTGRSKEVTSTVGSTVFANLS